jgi:hypothetical protein
MPRYVIWHMQAWGKGSAHGHRLLSGADPPEREDRRMGPASSGSTASTKPVPFWR